MEGKNNFIIAGFWRRIGAFLVDGLILGIALNILGFIFKNAAFQIGPYGRLIGWLIILIYFSLFNSKIGKGQTIGKRLLKIFVCAYRGQKISLLHSLSRTTIFSLPLLFNGWQLPILSSNTFFLTIATIIVFGIGGVIFYLLIFNRNNRQGLHDIICKTYVVKVSQETVTGNQLPKIPQIHIVISVIIIALSVGSVFAGRLFEAKTIMGVNIESLQSLHKELSFDTRFFNVSVFDQKFYSTRQKGPARLLKINGWYKGVPSSEEKKQCINDLAKIAMNSYPDMAAIDLLIVSVGSRYDLLFASGQLYYYDSKTIDEWKELLKKP